MKFTSINTFKAASAYFAELRITTSIALACVSLTCDPAYGYLDPVTGSFFVQGIVAAVLALVGGFRSIRLKIKHFFFRSKGGNVDDASMNGGAQKNDSTRD